MFLQVFSEEAKQTEGKKKNKKVIENKERKNDIKSSLKIKKLHIDKKPLIRFLFMMLGAKGFAPNGYHALFRIIFIKIYVKKTINIHNLIFLSGKNGL